MIYTYDKTGDKDEAVRGILKLREMLWGSQGNVSSRKAALMDMLYGWSLQGEPGCPRNVRFYVADVEVCYDFFARSSGLERRFLADCVRKVASAGDEMRITYTLGGEKAKDEALSMLPTASEELVCHFLDEFFSANAYLKNGGVDNDPAKTGVKTTRLTWRQIYDEFYVPFVNADGSFLSHLVVYEKFCRTRKKFRPKYVRDRKAR